ncbi:MULTISPECIES: hypothetical protein [Clostridium]|uniref:hypothetical protein n=1 Tax=Clostridium TaxID=1485 RepID=UPI0013F742E3|nr:MULTISPECIES: hypothetical protein [Clostridium]MBY7024002.1 hypothetical protein [Clostridium botulinum]NFO30131.1 hypothetical protein [Clostridium botulinum]NFO45898.1 hypothetical protein [Clostridium botulinum]NFO53046.1 hypothetical protein [Clostridium botulinum]
MYIDLFDKELIDYLMNYLQSKKVDKLNVSSRIVGDGIYQIRFENTNLVLQFFYEKEDENCEAQIRITNILLKGNVAKKGLSKEIINELLNFCNNHGNMSLWIYELINKSWKEYLVQNGAKVLKEESLYEGAVIWIPKIIN